MTTADFTNSDVWNEATGTWLRVACRDCVHAGTDPRYAAKVAICTHEQSKGDSIDRPTCFTSRMSGAPCGPGGRLYEARKS